jgi:hypothetical protein
VPGLGLEIEGIRFQVTAARPLTLKTVDGAFVVEQALFGDDEGADAIGGRELVERLCQRTGRSALRGEVFARPSESRELNQTGIDSSTGGK